MDFGFDDDAARRLARLARAADDGLRAVGPRRMQLAEAAAFDFAGAYADRFRDAVAVEAGDRVRLARALDELAGQVDTVAVLARRERDRRRDRSAWQQREAERRRTADADPLGALGVPHGFVVDPEPSAVPVRPVPVVATFSARRRSRTGTGTSNGRSSADPVRLRAYATGSRAIDRDAAEALGAVRSAWNGFVGSCPWVPIDGATIFAGIDTYLTEDDQDATWLERIAGAFERAGGGRSVSDAAIDVAVTGTVPAALRMLLADGLDPTEVAELWDALGYSKRNRADLLALPVPVLAALGNLEGIAYWARDAANRAVLDVRISAARAAGDRSQVAALRAIQRAMVGDVDAPRFLVSLVNDRPPLAAVAIGDLDTATNVTWAVPGMGSSAATMQGWTDASDVLFRSQRAAGATESAVVAWVGYHAPPIPDGDNRNLAVLGLGSAEAGAPNLAAAVRGLTASRHGHVPRLNVVAHSYGSTTAAVALTSAGVRVDSFTTIGSAGLPNGVRSAGDLHADHVYAGQAFNAPVGKDGAGDQWAALGRNAGFASHHVDPVSPGFGATAFGADGTGELKPVLDHGVHSSTGNGYLDPDTESLRNVANATTGHPEKLTAYHPKEPAVRREMWRDVVDATTRVPVLP